jgi:hypothetical protein
MNTNTDTDGEALLKQIQEIAQIVIDKRLSSIEIGQIKITKAFHEPIPLAPQTTQEQQAAIDEILFGSTEG